MYDVSVTLKNSNNKIEVLCDDCFFRQDILMITLNGVSLFMIPRENILFVKSSKK